MPSRSKAHTFVGRSAELATFSRVVDAARKGLPSVLLVGGDAGIGKSTLVNVGAERANAAIFLGRCLHIGGDVIPLAPILDLLRQIRRSSPEAITRSSEVASLAHWLTPSTSEGVANNPGAVFVPILQLITGLADQGAVVVGIEDLHWADAATWDLFEFLAHNLVDERIVLVGTYRANEIAANPAQRRRLAELTRLPIVERIHLEGLIREDVATRMASILGGPAPVSLIDEMFARDKEIRSSQRNSRPRISPEKRSPRSCPISSLPTWPAWTTRRGRYWESSPRSAATPATTC